MCSPLYLALKYRFKSFLPVNRDCLNIVSINKKYRECVIKSNLKLFMPMFMCMEGDNEKRCESSYISRKSILIRGVVIIMVTIANSLNTSVIDS
jgi:hypothetical protein